ncbi:hypothetical protein E3J61_04220 [Candidatus Dependentiae bacterium]|nr:MAG: hypothetical protein E3J61_04220 [Candidatus Dependentiae bacterium]
MKNRFAHCYAQRLFLAIVLIMNVSQPLHAAFQEKEISKQSSLGSPFNRFKKRVRAFIKCARDKSCKPGTKKAVIIAAVVLLGVVLKHKMGEQSRLLDAWIALGNRQWELRGKMNRSRELKRTFLTKLQRAEGARLAAYETDPEPKVFPRNLAEAIRLTSELESAMKPAK